VGKPAEYQVHILARAFNQLMSHAAFLARVSPGAAERLVDSFEKAANSLSLMPQRCPLLQGADVITQTYRSLLFEKHYLILFRVEDNTVYINKVLDCRQDYTWLLD
jgi:plasmid stabilization system protein ParE